MYQENLLTLRRCVRVCVCVCLSLSWVTSSLSKMRLVIVEPLASRSYCPFWSLGSFFLFLFSLFSFLCAVSMKSGKFIDCTYVALFLRIASHRSEPKYFNLYAADVKNNARPDRVVFPLPPCTPCSRCSLGHLSRRIIHPSPLSAQPTYLILSSRCYALMCPALIGSRAAQERWVD